jgi:magnesium transporter
MSMDQEAIEQHQAWVDVPWEALRQAIASGDSDVIVETISELGEAAALRGLLRLESEEREQLFSLMDAQEAANFLKMMPHSQASAVVNDLGVDEAVDAMAALNSHDKAEIIAGLETSHADDILEQMDDASEAQVRQLVAYAPDTAGSLMMLEAFSVEETQTIGGVLRQLGSEDEDANRYRGQFYPYVVDRAGNLLGVLSILRMLGEERTRSVQEVMMTPVTVLVDAPLDTLDEMFREHPFFNLPVVDAEGHLLGIVTRKSVKDALINRAGMDALKSAGIVGDETRSMPLWFRARRRLSWLSANIVLNIIAASVIAAYEQTLAAVIAIAIFLPMVSDMSGCSGNQAVAVSLRELALGVIRPADAFIVWVQEVSVGVLNGVVLGILIGLVAWVWKGIPALGLVIGLALAINTIIAVSVGGLVPLLLKKYNVDPAVASGPLLTTITDMAGFFLVLSLATLMMPYLV